MFFPIIYLLIYLSYDTYLNMNTIPWYFLSLKSSVYQPLISNVLHRFCVWSTTAILPTSVVLVSCIWGSLCHQPWCMIGLNLTWTMRRYVLFIFSKFSESIALSSNNCFINPSSSIMWPATKVVSSFVSPWTLGDT